MPVNFFVCTIHSTLCRSKVWKGMKFLQRNSIILGTRKLWWIVPIKQKFDNAAAFIDNPKCSIWTNLTIFWQCFQRQVGCTMVKKLSQNFRLVLNIFTIKKAAVVLNFCLIGKIHHNFLVPRMIRLVRQTFMSIQTLHRVWGIVTFWKVKLVKFA